MVKAKIVFKPNARAIRQLMRSKQVQDCLFGFAEPIAARATAQGHGRFEARPVGEGVTSRVGAHAFVTTADNHARNAERKYDILNSVL